MGGPKREYGIGMQAAKVQFHPPVRPAGSRIQPPQVAVTYSGESRSELIGRLLRAEARILELEDQLERSRPPF